MTHFESKAQIVNRGNNTAWSSLVYHIPIPAINKELPVYDNLRGIRTQIVFYRWSSRSTQRSPQGTCSGHSFLFLHVWSICHRRSSSWRFPDVSVAHIFKGAIHQATKKTDRMSSSIFWNSRLTWTRWIAFKPSIQNVPTPSLHISSKRSLISHCLTINASKLDWSTLSSFLTSAFLHLPSHAFLPSITSPSHISKIFSLSSSYYMRQIAVNLYWLDIYLEFRTSLEEDGFRRKLSSWRRPEFINFML